MLNWNLSDKEWQSWNQSKIQLKFVLFAKSLFFSLRWNICIDVTFGAKKLKLLMITLAFLMERFQPLSSYRWSTRFQIMGSFITSAERSYIITWFNFILLIQHLQLYYVYFVKLEYYLKVHMTRKISQEYLWNKNRYHKKKNAILLYLEKPFKLFFGSCAL